MCSAIRTLWLRSLVGLICDERKLHSFSISKKKTCAVLESVLGFLLISFSKKKV